MPNPNELASRLQKLLPFPQGSASVWVWQDGDKVSLRVRVDPWYRHHLDKLPNNFEGLPVVVEIRAPFDAATAVSLRPPALAHLSP